MTTIVTRAGKGSPLTHTEVDTNFTNLNTAKLETAAIPLGTAAAPSVSFLSDADSGLFSPGANQVAVATNGTGRVFVDANGNIGLGITPVANTFIGGARGSAIPSLIELAGNGNTVGSSGFVFGQDGSGVGILFQRSNAAMAFSTNGTERLRITAAGLVGIGSSSPQAQLHIALTASATTPIVNVGSFGTAGSVTLGSITNTSEHVYLGTGDSAGGGIAVGIGFMREAAGWNSALSFYTNNVTAGPNGVSAIQEKMRIDSSGRLLVGTGTGNANGGVLQLSGGITFPATAVAATDVNTLDDYEEGTWTPNQGSGLTVVGAFSSIGRYTKIGNVVTIWGDVTGATSIAVSAIGFITTNIPFALNNAIGAEGVATGFWSASNSVIRISTGATTTIYAAQAISGSATIGFTITYRV